MYFFIVFHIFSSFSDITFSDTPKWLNKIKFCSILYCVEKQLL